MNISRTNWKLPSNWLKGVRRNYNILIFTLSHFTFFVFFAPILIYNIYNIIYMYQGLFWSNAIICDEQAFYYRGWHLVNGNQCHELMSEYKRKKRGIGFFTYCIACYTLIHRNLKHAKLFSRADNRWVFSGLCQKCPKFNIIFCHCWWTNWNYSILILIWNNHWYIICRCIKL